MSEETRATGKDPIADWIAFDWRKAEQAVYRLQKRIYKAKSQGKTQVVHNLQRKLERSFYARMLATRRVTQDNQGKKTAGVDGKKDLDTKERLELVEDLKPKHRKRRKPLPVRRVWIPKPGKTEKRPLGIPTIRDRAEQALAKLALEPEWESVFEANSYGFRPGRSAHDAIGAIYNYVRYKPKWVLDADIAGCFDHISHETLLDKLQTYPATRRTIKGWLKAGVMDGQDFSGKTEEGTPQGGVISPLLANIALHGMETDLQKGYGVNQKPAVIRYADDFVVLCHTRKQAEEVKDKAAAWLAAMGLEMKPSKTRIVHTLEKTDGTVGFDFLGFNVRQYKVPMNKSARNGHGKPLEFKLLIKPTKEAVMTHKRQLKREIRSHRSHPQVSLLAKINPIIRGWTNYYKTVVSYECFSSLTWEVDNMLWQWARWSDHKLNGQEIKKKYWCMIGTRQTFGHKDCYVYHHTRTKIKRHRKVAGSASPFDGKLVYWAKRLYDAPITRNRLGAVLKRQGGKCAGCSLYLRDGDLIELDHFIPKRLGGKDVISNLYAYHRHCHDLKSRTDGSQGQRQEIMVSNDNGED